VKSNNDTIVALSTAYGISAISIVRLSGTLATNIASKITKKDKFIPRMALLSNLYFEDSRKLDEAIVIYFKSPKSFNGEDIVEFQTHGGIAIANIILDLCINYGARMANGGEFSKRALLNNKISIDKLETISKMIESKTNKSIDILSKNLSGDLQTFLNEIRESLVILLAHSEVSIDYGEEDLPSDLVENISKDIDDIVYKFSNILENTATSNKIIEGVRLSIIGKPNVGKSSTLNSIIGKDRAIISPEAGTTRDSIEELIQIQGHLIKIIDTAGIRNTNNNIEAIGVERSLKSINSSDMIIALFDGSKPLDDEDRVILDKLKDKQDKTIITLNKQDLGICINQKEFDGFKHKAIITASNNKIKPLIDKIKNILSTNTLTNEIFLSSQRQEDIFKITKNNLLEAKINIKDEDLEIFSFHIKESIEQIELVTKTYEHSELLDTMFSNFCLGK